MVESWEWAIPETTNKRFSNKDFFIYFKGISKNSLYPSLLEKGDGLRP